MPPQLTVVVATYNRPEALAFTLRCLVEQSFEDWIAFVVGDCCDARTGAEVARLGDSRVRFFNLPERCGDQSGPNSIGAAHCRTPHLAFLNHDDLLLPDHFERMLDRLEATQADIGFGQALGAYGWIDAAQTTPAFRAPAPFSGLSLTEAFASLPARAYEPVSAWMLKTSAYHRVGPWRDGYDLFRTPLNDWLLRASRARLRSCRLDVPTVVYATDHNRFTGRGGLYRAGAAMQEALYAEIEARGAEGFRAWAAPQAEPWDLSSRLRWLRADTPLRRAPLSVLIEAVGPALPALLTPCAWVYRQTGRDAYGWLCRLRGRRRGAVKQRSLAGRTGESRLATPDRARLVEAARVVLGT